MHTYFDMYASYFYESIMISARSHTVDVCACQFIPVSLLVHGFIS